MIPYVRDFSFAWLSASNAVANFEDLINFVKEPKTGKVSAMEILKIIARNLIYLSLLHFSHSLPSFSLSSLTIAL